MNPLIIGGLVVAGLLILLAVLLVLVKVFEKPLERSRSEVVDILRTAAEGRMDTQLWDDFVTIPIRDPVLDQVRETCWAELYANYHGTQEEGESEMSFSNPLARDRLRELIAALETDRLQTPAT